MSKHIHRYDIPPEMPHGSHAKRPSPSQQPQQQRHPLPQQPSQPHRAADMRNTSARYQKSVKRRRRLALRKKFLHIIAFTLLILACIALIVHALLAFLGQNEDLSFFTHVETNIGTTIHNQLSSLTISDTRAPEKPRQLPDTPIDSSKFNSKHIYVYDLTHNKEILNFDGGKKCAPASLVKLMTIYTSLAHIKNLDDPAPVDPGIFDELEKENASLAGFVAGEATTYRDLLYGTLMRSGGECALSLAVHTAPSIESFVAEMNENAKKLQLDNTVYKNPTGIDEDGQMSTARDVARVFAACLQDERFRKAVEAVSYLSTKTKEHPQGLLLKANIRSRIDEGDEDGFHIKGGKSGTTDLAGLCWATLCEKKGVEYIVVVMGVPYADINSAGLGQKEDTLTILRDYIK